METRRLEGKSSDSQIIYRVVLLKQTSFHKKNEFTIVVFIFQLRHHCLVQTQALLKVSGLHLRLRAQYQIHLIKIEIKAVNTIYV